MGTGQFGTTFSSDASSNVFRDSNGSQESLDARWKVAETKEVPMTNVVAERWAFVWPEVMISASGSFGTNGSSEGALIVTRTLFDGHPSSDARWKSFVAKEMALWPSFELRRRTFGVLAMGTGALAMGSWSGLTSSSPS